MRGKVFSLKTSAFSVNKADIHRIFSQLRYILKRYGILILFYGLLFSGLVCGALYAGNSDLSFMNSLDFLFSTNLEARLAHNPLQTFCACFTSDFIFLLSVFLLGFCPWGVPFIPMVLFFKGFGTGLTAAYLFMQYALKGAGFYLLVILPGTFLFCIGLVMVSVYSLGYSKRLFHTVINRNNPEPPMLSGTLSYCSRGMTYFILTFFSAILDTVLWSLLAGTFNL